MDKEHFLNLFKLARIDKQINSKEIQFLIRLGKKNGIDPEVLEKIIDDPTLADRLEITKQQSNKKEYLSRLYDFVCLILSDGVLDEREVALCTRLANQLGFNNSVVGDLIKALVTAADDQKEFDEIEEEVKIIVKTD